MMTFIKRLLGIPSQVSSRAIRITPGLAALTTGLLLSASLQAAELTPSPLEPSQDNAPVLTLQAADRREQLSLADIERLPLFETSMQHPEGPEGVYSGVLLNDFLAAHEFDDADRLRLVAWTTIPSSWHRANSATRPTCW